MNTRQLAAIWSGLAMFVASALFPPYVLFARIGANVYPYSADRQLLLRPVEPGFINLRQLAIEWIIIAVLITAAVVSLKERSR